MPTPIPIRLACLLLMAVIPVSSRAADVLFVGRVAEVLPWEKGDAAAPRVLADRFVYGRNDEAGHAYVMLPAFPEGTDPAKLSGFVTLNGADGAAVASVTVTPLTSRKLHVLFDSDALPPGDYLLQASLLGADGKPIGAVAPHGFTRDDAPPPGAPMPAAGLPLLVPPLGDAVSAAWPVHAAVPLPIGQVRDPAALSLLEDSQPIPADIVPAGRWSGRDDASLAWVHVHFTAHQRDGKPSTYALVRRPATATPTPALQVRSDDQTIRVDTGVICFEVSRTAFAGIERLWHDPSGRSRYELDTQVLSGKGGPYLVDGRAIRFDSEHGSEVTVDVEHVSPTRVVLRAAGWYDNPERRVPPICRFVTRITAWAGQPLVQVQHHTILAYDTRLQRIADLGFTLPMLDAQNYALGVDGQPVTGKLPAKGHRLFLHQDFHNHLRIVDTSQTSAKAVEGQCSDGWFHIEPAAAKADGGDVLDALVTHPRGMTVLLRDVWRKFPKQASLEQAGLTLHFWPRDGHRAVPPEYELQLEQIHKFLCFHQHRLLDLNLPGDYFDRLKQYPGMFENIPEHALNGNGQGIAIGNDFMLVFGDSSAVAAAPRLARLHQDPPSAMPPTKWNASTGVFGDIAAADDPDYQWVEQAAEQGFLSYTRSVERGANYGMFNYADTHTYWYPAENRPDLHRVWHNSHYHEVGKTWLLYFRSGSRDLLRWARASTDHYTNIDTINYADPANPLEFHTVGAMYHCKGCTHWGSEMYGMQRRDSHAGLWGHWVDPDAALWSWQIDANPRARDVYQTWHEAVRQRGLPLRGTRREINTSLAIACTLFQATHDPDILPCILGTGRSLREDEPLEDQNPGPMWHPLWMNRYFGLTRDPRYVPFILEHGAKTQIKDTWVVALSGLAHSLSQDPAFLKNHFDRLLQLPRHLYHNPGHPYDNYGWGPGPIGSRWFWIGWPYFLKQLQAAGIHQIDQQATPSGTYPFTSARHDYLNLPASLIVMAREDNDRAFRLKFRARSFGGDLHATSLAVYSPSGKRLHHVERIGAGGSSTSVDQTLAADGETGIYRIEFRAHEAGIFGPITDLDAEWSRADPNRAYRSSRLYSFARTIPADIAAEVTLTSLSNRFPSSYRVLDAKGDLVAEGSLFRDVGQTEAKIAIDPARHPQPWLIDTIGLASITYAGQGLEAVNVAPRPEQLPR